MLASSADRDRALELLKVSFVDGRLSKDELDERVGGALASHSFSELMELTADLPAGPLDRLPAHPVTPAPPRICRFAIVAVVFAFAVPFTLGLAGIPAVIFGHLAWRRMHRTRERGADMAAASLILGWIAILIVLVATCFVAFG